MNQQYPNPPFEQNITPPMAPPAPPDLLAVVNMPTAWKSAPSAVRFAIWVWAISVIASLAGVAVLVVLFAIGMNLAILGGN